MSEMVSTPEKVTKATIEKIVDILCPQLKKANCEHKSWWRADSGLGWCSDCGMCLNGRYERITDWDHPFFKTKSRRG